MRYNQLGRTGLLVSELCLGTMTFGGRGFWQAMGTLGQKEVDVIVRRSLEAGINFIDTADVYSEGLSEELTGQSLVNLKLKRSDVIIATKGYGKMGAGHNDRGASRSHIMDAVKASLKRMKLDYIDLYQIHGFDPITPVEETVPGTRRSRQARPHSLCRLLELARMAIDESAWHRRPQRLGTV